MWTFSRRERRMIESMLDDDDSDKDEEEEQQHERDGESLALKHHRHYAVGDSPESLLSTIHSVTSSGLSTVYSEDEPDEYDTETSTPSPRNPAANPPVRASDLRVTHLSPNGPGPDPFIITTSITRLCPPPDTTDSPTIRHWLRRLAPGPAPDSPRPLSQVSGNSASTAARTIRGPRPMLAMSSSSLLSLSLMPAAKDQPARPASHMPHGQSPRDAAGRRRVVPPPAQAQLHPSDAALRFKYSGMYGNAIFSTSDVSDNFHLFSRKHGDGDASQRKDEEEQRRRRRLRGICGRERVANATERND